MSIKSHTVLTALLNGQIISANGQGIHVEDRGLSYGDGVFETMLLRNGNVRFLSRHYARLQLGCQRLGIVAPSLDTLKADVAAVANEQPNGIVKIIVTRGVGGRGYRASAENQSTRITLSYPPLSRIDSTIKVRWCITRLARSVHLAGIKHLNRLEQVLAQNEWLQLGVGDEIAEGLMMDTEGELIAGTTGNIFLVSDGILVTPDLRFSGIRGVMREFVIDEAKRCNLSVEERAVWPDELQSAQEVFVTNAIRGIRSVVALDQLNWPIGSVAKQLSKALERIDRDNSNE